MLPADEKVRYNPRNVTFSDNAYVFEEAHERYESTKLMQIAGMTNSQNPPILQILQTHRIHRFYNSTDTMDPV